MKFIKRIIIFLGTFMLYHILFSSFFPVDENNVLQAPDWYTYLGLLVSAITAIFFTIKRNTTKPNHNPAPSSPRLQSIKLLGKEPPIEPVIATRQIDVQPQRTYEPVRHIDTVETQLYAIDCMEGHEFEFWCADALRKLGYRYVEVTPGSGDQGVDVLAQKDGIKYAVQCKRYNSDLGNKPVQEVYAGKAIYHCHVGVVITNQHFTSGAKQLATATDTILWDREWIRSYLESQSHPVALYSSPTSPVEHVENDELFPFAVDVVLETGQASVSMLQRRLGIGYARAARLIDTMEERGIVAPFIGSKPRAILITKQQWQSARNN